MNYATPEKVHTTIAHIHTLLKDEASANFTVKDTGSDASGYRRLTFTMYYSQNTQHETNLQIIKGQVTDMNEVSRNYPPLEYDRTFNENDFIAIFGNLVLDSIENTEHLKFFSTLLPNTVTIQAALILAQDTYEHKVTLDDIVYDILTLNASYENLTVEKLATLARIDYSETTQEDISLYLKAPSSWTATLTGYLPLKRSLQSYSIATLTNTKGERETIRI